VGPLGAVRVTKAPKGRIRCMSFCETVGAGNVKYDIYWGDKKYIEIFVGKLHVFGSHGNLRLDGRVT
jgi:hypothetical protein